VSAERLAAYRDFLVGRDGEPDLRRSTLPAREAFFARLDAAPVRSQREPDRAVFLRNLRTRRPEPGLDELVLWLLATAKANQSERFGVGLAELYGRAGLPGGDRTQIHVNLQEHYHTRILADVVEMFGLPVPAQPPPFLTRMLVRRLVLSPERLVLPLVGCAEMIGCVLFRALRDRGVALCADEPRVAGRVRLLYDEILADEVSHVGYVAARLGPAGRRTMRRLFAVIGPRLMRQSAEVGTLFSREEVAAWFRGFHLEPILDEVAERAYVCLPI
jgi:hypothetical protein